MAQDISAIWAKVRSNDWLDHSAAVVTLDADVMGVSPASFGLARPGDMPADRPEKRC